MLKRRKKKGKLRNKGKRIPFCVLVLESLHVPSLQKILYCFETLMERHNKYRHSSSLLSKSISESVEFSFSCQNQHTHMEYCKNFLCKTQDIFKTLLSTIYPILVHQACISSLLHLDLTNHDGPDPFLNSPGHLVSLVESPETPTMARRIRINSKRDQFYRRNSQTAVIFQSKLSQPTKDSLIVKMTN